MDSGLARPEIPPSDAPKATPCQGHPRCAGIGLRSAELMEGFFISAAEMLHSSTRQGESSHTLQDHANMLTHFSGSREIPARRAPPGSARLELNLKATRAGKFQQDKQKLRLGLGCGGGEVARERSKIE